MYIEAASLVGCDVGDYDGELLKYICLPNGLHWLSFSGGGYLSILQFWFSLGMFVIAIMMFAKVCGCCVRGEVVM
ncbi:hypothetical protein EON65_44745 [archaeon]|nr:MAG: hypothetical protein EON65_44745 [archaeon]